jgi:hypothetical protein
VPQNEAGAPENRIVVLRTCPDAPSRNLHPVLGPVVTARRYFTICVHIEGLLDRFPVDLVRHVITVDDGVFGIALERRRAYSADDGHGLPLVPGHTRISGDHVHAGRGSAAGAQPQGGILSMTGRKLSATLLGMALDGQIDLANSDAVLMEILGVLRDKSHRTALIAGSSLLPRRSPGDRSPDRQPAKR